VDHKCLMSVDLPAPAASRVGSIARGAVFRALCTRFATLKRDNDFNGLMQSFRSNACKILEDHLSENSANVGVMQQILQGIADIFSILNSTAIATRRSVANELEPYVSNLENIYSEIMDKAAELNNRSLQELGMQIDVMVDTFFDGMDGGSDSGSDHEMPFPQMMAAGPPAQIAHVQGNPEGSESENED
jgi:hypothetical protein